MNTTLHRPPTESGSEENPILFGANEPPYRFPILNYKGAVNLHWGTVSGGSDLFAPRGSTIISMWNGYVDWAGWDDVGGWNVLVIWDNQLQCYMAHLNKEPLVRTGQNVVSGSVLGELGNTGNASATDPHLHIGIGPSIIHGTGPYGGTGGDYDAVGLLQRALARDQSGASDVLAIPGFDYDVSTSVIAESTKVGMPALMILALAHGEGGLKKPFPKGDGGISEGPFQVNTQVHGHANWDDPAVAIPYLYDWNWKTQFDALGGWTKWWYDHYAFIKAWAPKAQISIPWTDEKSHVCVGHAFDTYVLTMKKALEIANSGGDPDAINWELKYNELKADWIDAEQRDYKVLMDEATKSAVRIENLQGDQKVTQ